MAAIAAAAADVRGWTHAAAHLRHYLRNSGDTLTVNADSVLHDVPEVNAEANRRAAGEIRRIALAAVAAEDYDNPTTFQSKWGEGISIAQDAYPDWFLAMGSIRLATSGSVTTREGAGGAAPSVIAEYRIHIYDRYNWDSGKTTQIAGRTVTDKQLGELHTAGLAREYDIEGTSDVRRYSGQIPAGGNLPGSGDSRDGERTDPTRTLP
ncbi:hypothetical protein [Nocardia sp. NPDC051832]|uniref:hypothetical protein n=1 Tax=Nocardia sp. NPDC051832 TaxID=3155673 RepID=UPI003424A1DC